MKSSVFLYAALLLSCIAGAQNLPATLAQYGDRFQAEKIYLHYDKSSYFAGETIWFKAYLTEEMYPSSKSKTLYVDWVGDKGEVLMHTVAPVVDGGTNGQFEIPSSYNGNFIHVRAYTRWMLNFDTAFLYSKELPVLTRTTVKPVKTTLQYALQFFPEGGDLIEGATNNIAFKANDQYGRPATVKGVLLNGKGTVIDSVKSMHDGMGAFSLLPDAGGPYMVRWKDGNGTVQQTALPKPAKGLSMQVSPTGSRRTVLLNSTSGSVSGNLYLVGTMNQRTAFQTTVSLDESGSARRVIPVENLPSGILTITVFDNSWKALAERVLFVNNNDFRFNTSMEVKHWGLGKRKRNEIQITLPDSVSAASYSIAVTDASIGSDSSEHIISRLLLTSDIRGHVYRPAYYFSNNSETVARHLDLVMLTHGWRRFDWEAMAAGQLPQAPLGNDSTYLALSGKVLGVNKNQLNGSDNIILLVKEDTATKMVVIPIDRNGEFREPDVVIFDTMQVYYSVKSKFFKDAEASFMPDRLAPGNYTAQSKGWLNFHPYLDTLGNYRHRLIAGESLRLKELEKTKMLENVTVKARQKTPAQLMDDKYASAFFKGGDGYSFDLVNDVAAQGAFNALTYLAGRVAGLQVNANSNPPSLTWRGGAPGLFLDEIPADASLVSSIPIADVAYIKVFRPPFMGASNGGSGAIAIYTRRGDDRQTTSGKGMATTKIAGYTPIRQFYSPNYDRFDPRNEGPDNRTTLYWNPNLTAGEGKRTVSFTFYNNDSAKAFRVIIQGMSSEGWMTHHEEILE